MSGKKLGWSQITFTGARVLDVQVTGPAGETLKGTFAKTFQKWTLRKHHMPDELTIGVAWTVTITVK